MLDLLDQVDAAADAGLYYVALAGALVVPDLCAALAESSGRTTGPRYMAWFRANYPAEYEEYLNAEECYGFRCSFLHQGNSYPHKTGLRILFLEPVNPVGTMHRMRLDDHLMLDVRLFCKEMTEAARKWWKASQGREPFETNVKKFIKRNLSGISPFIVGVPVIG